MYFIGLALTTNKTWNWAFIFHGIAFGMLPTFIPLYFIDCLKGSLFDFGVMSAVATLSSILTLIYAGRLPERYERSKPFIAISFLLSSVCLFALTQATNVFLFQILYILLGITNSIYPPSTRLLIAETYHKADWSRMFAWHNLVVGFSNTLGLAICSLFVSSLGYGTLLFICAPLVFTSFLLALVVVKDPPIYMERWLSRVSRPIDDVESLSYWLGSKRSAGQFSLKSTVNMGLFGLGTLIFAMASSAFGSSLPIYLSNVVFMAPSMIFAVFFGRSFIGSISYIVVSRFIGEEGGGNAVKMASITRAALVFILPSIAFLPPLAPIVAVLLLSAVNFSWSLYSVGKSVMVVDFASEGSVGIYDALGSVGSVVGGLLSGLIPAMFSFNLLFIIASTLFLIAFLIFWKSTS